VRPTSAPNIAKALRTRYAEAAAALMAIETAEDREPKRVVLGGIRPKGSPVVLGGIVPRGTPVLLGGVRPPAQPSQEAPR